VSAAVVAVLHHLERPFSGHAGAVLDGAGVVLDERDVPVLGVCLGGRHLAGQRALSEALFGGFARVVDALRRDDRARSASRGGR
jgi:hypothetical protein